MKKERNSNSLLELLRPIFKPKKFPLKDNTPKHTPSWMYRNE